MSHTCSGPLAGRNFNTRGDSVGEVNSSVLATTILNVRILAGAPGGADRIVLDTPRFLQGTRYRALTCYLRSPHDEPFSEVRKWANERGHALIEIDDWRPLDLSTVQSLASVCRLENVRIWHGHDYKSTFFGVLLRRWLGFRIVATAHGWVQRTARTTVYFSIERQLLRYCDQVIAVSTDLFDRCRRAGVPHDRLHLIENAVDTDEFRRPCEKASWAREAFCNSKRGMVIGAMGRLSKEKGFDLLIDAFTTLLQQYKNLELWIAGDGPERESLVARAVANGLGSSVRFLGFQTDPREFFGRIDTFCIASRREGLPKVLLEAMAMKLPVITTRCGGVARFGRNSEDMIIVPVGRMEELAKAIERLLLDPTLRTVLGVAARRRVENECSLAQNMKRVTEIYDRLV